MIIRELLTSKKFLTSLLGLAVAIAVKLGVPEVQAGEIVELLSPLIAYIVAQGVADVGKEKAKNEPTR